MMVPALPPAPPAPPMHMCPRHQAQPVVSDPGNSCALRISSHRAPPNPHDEFGGPCRQERGGAAAAGRYFWRASSRGYAGISVDSIDRNYPTPYSTKRRARSQRFQPPRIALSLPRVDPFSPRVHFSGRAPLCPFSLSFSEEKKEKKGERGRVRRSTGPKNHEKVYPRVSGCIDLQPVDQKIKKSVCGRGVTCNGSCIHGSTGCFPCGTPASRQLEA